MEDLKIIKYPDSILRLKAKKVKEPFDSDIQELISSMKKTLIKKEDGLGLAAPQVGKSIRIFVIINEGGTEVFVNPQIKFFSRDKTTMEEGCLSLPGKFLPVKRASMIRVRYLNETGKKCKMKASGLLARTVQHELDHLNGILILDRTKNS